MNLKLSYQHLKQYLKCSLEIEEFASIMSESVASVEHIQKFPNDSIFEFEITPNRIDLASALGLARDMHASLQYQGHKCQLQLPQTLLKPKTDYFPKYLEIDKKLVSGFACMLIENIDLVTPDKFVQSTLENMGVHLVSPLVDISNFINYDMGLPIHIFDFDALGKKLKIRSSKVGEKITLLDTSELTLDEGEIVGEDAYGNLCDLCGVMGGKSSAVSEKTKNILIWVPLYDKMRVRKSSLRHQKRTLASEYFEKDLDSGIIPLVMEKTLEMVSQVAPEAKRGIYYASCTIPTSKVITTSQSKIEKMIGCKISLEQIESILSSLGFGISNTRADVLSVRVPSYRHHDIEGEADIIEEVARLFGYQKLPYCPTPLVSLGSRGKTNQFATENQLRNFLAINGYNELISYSLTSSGVLENMGLNPSHHLKVSQSISEEFNYLKTHALTSFLPVLQNNRGFFDTQKIFEIGKLYLPQKSGLPLEKKVLSMISNAGLDDMMALFDNFESFFQIQFEFRKSHADKFLTPGSCTLLTCNGEIVGHVGILNSLVLDKFSLSGIYCFLEFDLEKFCKNLGTNRGLVQSSGFASIARDLTFSKKQANFGEIASHIQKIDKKVKNVYFLGEYAENYSIRIHFSSDNENISDQVVNELIDKIKTKIEELK